MEEGLHVEAECLVVVFDGSPAVGVRGGWLVAETGQEGFEDVVAEGGDGGDGANRVRRDLVSAGPARFFDEVLGPKLSQVTGPPSVL
jgi:hypothetical protein